MSLAAHLGLFLPALGLMSLIMTGLWMLSRRIGDPSFIDAFWPAGFVILGWLGFWLSGAEANMTIALPVLVSVWGMRLASHLFDRWCTLGADPRYERLMEGRASPGMFSLWFIFGLQGGLILIIGWPLLVAPSYSDHVGWTAALGALLFLVGFLFEAIGDKQLREFRADPLNEGKVLDTGLWRYTRHPNYFGDATLWWGLWLVALDMGVPFVSALCPALMSYLLMQWSGVPLLERSMQKTRPGYGDYAARTSVFFPWPPKK